MRPSLPCASPRRPHSLGPGRRFRQSFKTADNSSADAGARQVPPGPAASPRPDALPTYPSPLSPLQSAYPCSSSYTVRVSVRARRGKWRRL
jgi:hypothetical protein